jgi:hypothetical protein
MPRWSQLAQMEPAGSSFRIFVVYGSKILKKLAQVKVYFLRILVKIPCQIIFPELSYELERTQKVTQFSNFTRA